MVNTYGCGNGKIFYDAANFTCDFSVVAMVLRDRLTVFDAPVLLLCKLDIGVNDANKRITRKSIFVAFLNIGL